VSKAHRFLERAEPLRDGLTAYCLRLLWFPGDLEDALQETLAVAYRDYVGDTEGRAGEFRTWIFRIATWTCFGLNRRRGRTPALDSALDPAVEDAGGALEVLERECSYEEILANPAAAFDGLGDELARACRRLTEKERSILLLKTLGGLTCAEIATVLELPLGTAQGLLGRAHQKMRAHLADFARARGLPSPRSAP
jgi:RNA polymerase sigma-70 factor (ECF subfamily)